MRAHSEETVVDRTGLGYPELKRVIPHRKCVIQFRETEFDEKGFARTGRIKYKLARTASKSFVPGITLEEITKAVWDVLKPYMAK